jgi:ATP-dependent DNA ligase
VFAKVCELDLEGIVSKRAGSFYKSGPSRNWLKTKNPDFVEDPKLARRTCCSPGWTVVNI